MIGFNAPFKYEAVDPHANAMRYPSEIGLSRKLCTVKMIIRMITGVHDTKNRIMTEKIDLFTAFSKFMRRIEAASCDTEFSRHLSCICILWSRTILLICLALMHMNVKLDVPSIAKANGLKIFMAVSSYINDEATCSNWKSIAGVVGIILLFRYV